MNKQQQRFGLTLGQTLKKLTKCTIFDVTAQDM